jgi:hypothetical protein
MSVCGWWVVKVGGKGMEKKKAKHRYATYAARHSTISLSISSTVYWPYRMAISPFTLWFFWCSFYIFELINIFTPSCKKF